MSGDETGVTSHQFYQSYPVACSLRFDMSCIDCFTGFFHGSIESKSFMNKKNIVVYSFRNSHN